MHLVDDHVLQSLVVDRAEEDEGRHRLAADAAVEEVLTMIVEAVRHQPP